MRKARIILILLLASVHLTATAQERKVQNKPYIDLRPLHFGIHVGLNMQDIMLQDAGPQTILLDDEMSEPQTVVVADDRWNAGFSVGVLADLRLTNHLNLRLTPTMHFGTKHLTFHNLTTLNAEGNPTEETQNLKNTYIAFPLSLKFSAQRWNNYRPYLIGGISQMINLSGKDQDFIRLKRTDTFIEIGLGCDFYLPFFKLIPELKFCYGLTDAVDRQHASELKDANKRIYTNAVAGGHSKMIVLTLYFE